jgi:hypothetical protein
MGEDMDGISGWLARVYRDRGHTQSMRRGDEYWHVRTELGRKKLYHSLPGAKILCGSEADTSYDVRQVWTSPPEVRKFRDVFLTSLHRCRRDPPGPWTATSTPQETSRHTRKKLWRFRFPSVWPVPLNVMGWMATEH